MKKTPAKRAAPKKSAPKSKPKAPRASRAGARADEQREFHYTDLRKVLLANVLKRLK